MSGLRHDEDDSAEAKVNQHRRRKDLLCGDRKRDQHGENEGVKERTKEIEKSSASTEQDMTLDSSGNDLCILSFVTWPHNSRHPGVS